MNVQKTIMQIVLICAISILICYLMVNNAIKKQKPHYESIERIELLESRMDINRDLYEKMNLKIDSLLKIKTKTDVQIVRIRSNKGLANPYISNMSSSDLFRTLSDRYKDSIQ